MFSVEVSLYQVDNRRDAKRFSDEGTRPSIRSCIIGDISDGAAPLWLRLEPLRFNDAGDLLTHLPHVALDLSLDLHQVWAPSGVERVKSVAKLQKMHAWRPAAHKRDGVRLARMYATSSIGWITDVALALIAQRGLNPAEVFRQERDGSLHGGWSSHWGVVDHFGGLFRHHGILSPYFRLDGGDYNDGTLTIYRNIPHTLAAGAAGRPLAAFVNHPAFVASGATVTRASSSTADWKWSTSRGSSLSKRRNAGGCPRRVRPSTIPVEAPALPRRNVGHAPSRPVHCRWPGRHPGSWEGRDQNQNEAMSFQAWCVHWRTALLTSTPYPPRSIPSSINW